MMPGRFELDPFSDSVQVDMDAESGVGLLDFRLVGGIS